MLQLPIRQRDSRTAPSTAMVAGTAPAARTAASIFRATAKVGWSRQPMADDGSLQPTTSTRQRRRGLIGEIDGGPRSRGCGSARTVTIGESATGTFGALQQARPDFQARQSSGDWAPESGREPGADAMSSARA